MMIDIKSGMILLVSVTLVVFILGVSLGLRIGKDSVERGLAGMTGGTVECIVWYDNGCSVLVEYPNRISRWVWMEVIDD